MPNGRRHTIASCVVGAASGAALILYSPEAAFWCTTGALAGILLTPDNDLRGNITYHYVKKYAGLPAYFLWKLVWWCYGFIPHRSPLSHAPVLSTIIRLLYLWLWILPIWYYLQLPWPTFSVNAGWWLIGLGLADIAHGWLDFLDSRLGGRL